VAFLKIKNVAIRGVSACVPKKVVNNDESLLLTEIEKQRFYDSVGIYRRRCADEGMTTADLCFMVAESIIKELNWDKSEVEALIFVTQTPDYRNPATSCILQHRLGLPDTCQSFDVSMGCSGYIYGLSIISSIMSSGYVKKALLLVGDTASLTSSPEDKSRVMLFGDAGTATALEYDETAEEIAVQLGTDGSGYKTIITPDSGFRNRVTPASFRMEDFGNGIKRARVHTLMDGLGVFSFAIRRAPQSVNQLCDYFSIKKENVDYFLFHQANMMINEMIRKKLKLPIEKVPYHLKDFGNTSCASIPLLMVTNLRNELKSKEISAILCAFGVGLSWGSIFIRFNRIICPDLLEL